MNQPKRIYLNDNMNSMNSINNIHDMHNIGRRMNTNIVVDMNDN